MTSRMKLFAAFAGATLLAGAPALAQHGGGHGGGMPGGMAGGLHGGFGGSLGSQGGPLGMPGGFNNGMDVRTDARMENGFRWLTVGPKGQPDLEIASQGENAKMDPSGRVILLRPERDGDDQQSIYRYDRAGLLMALKAVGAGGGK